MNKFTISVIVLILAVVGGLTAVVLHTDNVKKSLELEKGDIATINYSLEVDGKNIESVQGTEQQFSVGSEQPNKLIDDKLIGHKIGDKFSFESDLPEEMTEDNDELADVKDKKGKFTVTVVDIDYATRKANDAERANKFRDEEETKNLEEEMKNRAKEYEQDASDAQKKLTIEDGDTVTIDYLGTVDGKAFTGGNTLESDGEPYELVIGSGSFIEGFEEQLVGHKVGENFNIEVQFPDEYQDDQLAGKKATFNISVKSIAKENEAGSEV